MYILMMVIHCYLHNDWIMYFYPVCNVLISDSVVVCLVGCKKEKVLVCPLIISGSGVPYAKPDVFIRSHGN